MSVQFAFCAAGDAGRIAAGSLVGAETITEGQVSKQTTIAAAGGAGAILVCRVATTNPCYVAFGPNPVAGNNQFSFLLPTDFVGAFEVNAGDKAACSGLGG